MAEQPRPPDEFAPPIPPQVRRRARQAEELQKQMHGGGEGEETPPQEVPQEPPSQEPPSQEPPPQQAPPPPETTTPADWEQRYRTLQGKYDREIPQMRAQIQSLEGLISTMRTAPPPVTLPPPESVAPQPAVSEEDIQVYGPELPEATRRWARAEVQSEINELRSEVQRLRQGHDQQTRQQSTSKLEQELDRDPELSQGRWQQLNHDQNFIQWLQEIDPFSGVSRYVMLNHAYAGGDAERTGRFFKAYMREHTDRNLPVSSPPQTYNGNGVVDAGQPPRLEDFAAPGRAPRATPGGGAPEKRIWTNRDITAFYEDRTRGKYRGREEDAERLERDIFDAASEGRVRNA